MPIVLKRAQYYCRAVISILINARKIKYKSFISVVTIFRLCSIEDNRSIEQKKPELI